MQIHLHRAGQQSGPHTLEEVRSKLQCGALSLNDMAWYPEIPNWIPVAQLPGLAATVGGVSPVGALSQLQPAASPPRRGLIILGAVGTILLALALFFGGLFLFVDLKKGDSPLPGILLVLLGVTGFIVAIQFFCALSRNPTGCCQICGQPKPTIKGSLNRHTGAVILMFHRSLNGHMCKECLSKVFWEFTPMTLGLGWWGFFSFFITPVVLVNNVAFFVRSRFMK